MITAGSKQLRGNGEQLLTARKPVLGRHLWHRFSLSRCPRARRPESRLDQSTGWTV
ncbi:hypothetical protein BZL30_9108 [Mycobacterium kansasii]|uniref:Uncharacterized protein n=1 Tax=Mycobacterium kansasii TaxID=1768 RepID=A0A1V3WC37_MYCKA|nr:hypothetical protein BZL30_9108 [Mycobacterium kansasii]